MFQKFQISYFQTEVLGGDTVEHVDVRDRGGTEVLGGDTVEHADVRVSEDVFQFLDQPNDKMLKKISFPFPK